MRQAAGNSKSPILGVENAERAKRVIKIGGMVKLFRAEDHLARSLSVNRVAPCRLVIVVSA